MNEGFSVGGVLNSTFNIYFKSFANLFAIGLVANLPVYVLQAIVVTNADPYSNVTPLIVPLTFIVVFVLVYIMQGTVIHGVYEGLNNRPFVLADSVSVGLRRGGIVILVAVVTSFLTMIGSLFFLVPGLMVMCALWAAIPIVVVEGKGVGAAIGRSRELTVGYRMRIFGIVVVMGIIGFVFSMITGFISVAIAADGSTAGLWISTIIDGVTQAMSSTLSAVSVAVGYYHLRMDVEGLDLSELVSVFD